MEKINHFYQRYKPCSSIILENCGRDVKVFNKEDLHLAFLQSISLN